MQSNTQKSAVLIGAFRQKTATATVTAIIKAVKVHMVLQPEGLENPINLPALPSETFQSLGNALRENFQNQTPIIALCATGIVVRALADLLHNKYLESPVLVVAEDGSCVIPLLGGHHGGNLLAKKIAAELNINPAITTASEQHLGFALDVPPEGWKIGNHAAINTIMARLLSNQPVRLQQDCPNTDFPPQDAFSNEETPYAVQVTDRTTEDQETTVYLNPPSIILGIGCERGCSSKAIEELVLTTLASHKISTKSIAAIATVALKADEPAIHALADKFNVPIKIFSVDTLEALTDRIQLPSQTVFAEIGCHSVAEASAIACAGTSAETIVAKAKNLHATLSIVRRSDYQKLSGRNLGTLHVVGTGPGDIGNHTNALKNVLRSCDTSIGYGLYLDLVSDFIQHTQQIRSPLGNEQKRVEEAIAKAQEGHHVALICSGDPGIYALATLVFEVLEQQNIRAQFRLNIHPGITAMQAAAAKLGAPLGHDFLAISLSDLLTPPATIRLRLQAAAEGDFVTSFYNPQSRTRRTLLPEAKETFLAYRPPETPVAICRNIGREEEEFIITTLKAFQPEQVDMLSLVMIGNSMTRLSKNTPNTYLYTPRGYIEPINQPNTIKE